MTSASFDRSASFSLAGLGLLLGLTVFAAPAQAQGTQAQRDACTGDAMSLCSEFIPDPGRTGACLARKRAQLSPACRVVFGGSPVKKTRVAKAKRRTKVAKKSTRRK